MKKDTMILLGLLFLVITGCQDELVNDDLFFYQEESSVNSRSTTSWFDCNKCVLQSGAEVQLPWNTTAITTIPDEIREDVKEEDGWRILFTSVDILGYSETVTDTDVSGNYLLMYNRYTGMLKGFYYAENIVQENNNAYWLLTISDSTKLFNFVPYFAEPINSLDAPRQISLSTISTNGIVNGFDVGWNCFMQELAYDENSMNERLSISGYALNKSTITFKGSYNSLSEGTIVSSPTTNKNGILDGIAKGFGSASKDWIKDNAGSSGNKAIKFATSVVCEAMDNGISGLVSKGLYKVFGSVLGTTRTTYDLQYTTNGSITIAGESQTPGTGYITPLAGIPLDGIGENLGLWNLAEAPKHIANPIAVLKDISNAQTGSDYIYNLTFSQSFNIVKNPVVSTSVATSCDVVSYNKYNGKNVTWKSQYNTSATSAYRVSNSVLYSDSVTVINASSNSYNVCVRNLLPNKVYGSNSPAYDLSQNSVNIWENTAVIVKLSLTNNGITTYSTKTFIPKCVMGTGSARPYSWTYQELINKGF